MSQCSGTDDCPGHHNVHEGVEGCGWFRKADGSPSRTLTGSVASELHEAREFVIDYWQVAGALCRAFNGDSDAEGFADVVVELEKVYPQFAWANAMTDQWPLRADSCGQCEWCLGPPSDKQIGELPRLHCPHGFGCCRNCPTCTPYATGQP